MVRPAVDLRRLRRRFEQKRARSFARVCFELLIRLSRRRAGVGRGEARVSRDERSDEGNGYEAGRNERGRERRESFGAWSAPAIFFQSACFRFVSFAAKA